MFVVDGGSAVGCDSGVSKVVSSCPSTLPWYLLPACYFNETVFNIDVNR